MGKNIFVSYSHKQGDWVWGRLVPCLRAGGAEILIDRERFRAGENIFTQMDETQDKAEIQVLVLSPEYLTSESCLHEMKRAIKRGKVVPILKADCNLPDYIKKILYIDLRNDKNSEQWDKLLKGCDADLGCEVPHWFKVRDEICTSIRDRQSANLIVHGNVKWRELIDHIRNSAIGDLVRVDLGKPNILSRRDLVVEIANALKISTNIPEEPKDLAELYRLLSLRADVSKLAFTHFDVVKSRPYYDVDLFTTLRYLIMESRNLVLLVQSRQHIAELLPQDGLLSPINFQTIELKGRIESQFALTPGNGSNPA
jgi:hypothetical protein